ncbi:hypothetical protein EOPP23_12770 [Endozoicomonas sp. OPT23]|uniref:MaoC family dehydratase n=1 Tax=Endozoicomonas sp. OPT23 TaxID=2072845 RepID=UPI00129A4EF4|nr:MaoC family dehydratase [Endozoicomonas sp. OPT23]MRI33860.1 hypothetical protein [Endozoicomonas sp. OPT23]
MNSVNQAFQNLSFADIEVGQKLPGLDIDVTTELVVAGAMASRDYQDVHHNKANAQKLGSKDIFMNILTTNGLVGRYITDWTGPLAVLRKVNIKLGAPNFPGEVMKLSGKVTDKSEQDGQSLVEISVAGKNSMGNHVTGTVVVALPQDSMPKE